MTKTMPASVNKPHMTKVLLINQEKVPHYRVAVYNRLSEYLKQENFALTVASGGIQDGSTHAVEFDFRAAPLSFLLLAKLLLEIKPDILIFWVGLKFLYLYPILFLAKILGRQTIHWGHGSDLLKPKGLGLTLRTFAYNIDFRMASAIILYAQHLKKNVKAKFQNKIFIANNTLALDYVPNAHFDKASCLSKYKITTAKNIICCGRMQRRKRIENLVAAFKLLDRRDVGLILAGPDPEGVLRDVRGGNLHILGPMYGDEIMELLFACDVFCLPGAVGLSIVDAFYCGLPIVTEEGDESPEIMYLKDGVNGFVVPRGDVRQLMEKLERLLDNDALRKQFSIAAREEIMTNGHVDKMCQGFSDALRFVRDGRSAAGESLGRTTPALRRKSS
jgi:glycosyltransferase involved in cell wall biosynthesis